MPKASRPLFCLSLTLFGAAALYTGAFPQQKSQPNFGVAVQPFLGKYCISCHSGASPAAGVDFTKFLNETQVIDSPDVWTQAARYLASKHMPPANSAQPNESDRARLVQWIQKTLTSPCGLNEPGRVTICRLNRTEYANTIRDLLGVEFKGTDDFPSDDVGYGFDNIGDVLSISPLLMEKYLNASEQIAESAILDRKGQTVSYDPDSFKFKTGNFAAMRDGDLELYTEGTVTLVHDFTGLGDYWMRIRAYGDQAGPDPCQMAVSLDGKTVAKLAVKGEGKAQAADYEIPFEASSGKHEIGIAFTNDYYNPKAADPKQRDRNLYLAGMEIQGPQIPDVLIPSGQLRLIPHLPDRGQEMQAARSIFAPLASRAYRRPATDDEVNRLCQYVTLVLKNGDSFDRGIQLGIEAMLSSPNFLFRVETDPKANDPNSKDRLNSYELASRLSYFLWSSMPDQTLFDLAKTGALEDPKILVEQAERMLKDPKASALADDFATQWLTLRKLAIVSPDKKIYPDFNDQMRQDMEHETKLFFSSIVDSDGNVLDFLDGRYSFINARLAKLYGIPGVTGDEFRKVSLQGTNRCGILTQASVLTVTSNPTRTSPVKRGKWVLEEILGTPPPPAPPGVGVLQEQEAVSGAVTLRQMMEVHRKNPMCAACHERMDPLGFGLENFDGIGKWRSQEGKFAIDSSGKLPDGRTFDGPLGLVKILMGQKDLFVRCLAEKMLTYALGRGLTPSDQCVLDGMEKQTKAGGYRFSALVKAIVLSTPFRMRGADAG